MWVLEEDCCWADLRWRWLPFCDRNSKMGDEIDAHETVLRINYAPTKVMQLGSTALGAGGCI
jgi:hypothetical protein